MNWTRAVAADSIVCAHQDAANVNGCIMFEPVTARINVPGHPRGLARGGLGGDRDDDGRILTRR